MEKITIKVSAPHIKHQVALEKLRAEFSQKCTRINQEFKIKLSKVKNEDEKEELIGKMESSIEKEMSQLKANIAKINRNFFSDIEKDLEVEEKEQINNLDKLIANL